MATLTQALRDRLENTIRFLAADAVQRANSGHPGAPMGLARPAFQLWDQHIRFDPSDPAWPLRDRFILSNGHASMLLYALLHLYGFDLTHQDIADFRKLGSKTAGHPEYGDTPGVEVTTGPLGQGFAHGVGMALAAKATAARFGEGGQGPGQHHVYAICGDGDLMEGISSEAGSLAGHLGLGNLIYLYDDNDITIDGPADISFSEDVAKRFEAQRWHVQSIDGEDVAGLDAAVSAAREERERPSIIVMKTVIGRGSEAVAGKSKAHGAPLGADEVKRSKEAVGFPPDQELYVPDEVRAYFAERIEAKRAERAQADQGLAGWRKGAGAKAAAWDAARSGALPAGLADALVEAVGDGDDATRNHGKRALEALAEQLPHVIGGSADLAGSNAPPILKGKGTVGQGAEGDPFAGVNVHFGVREHAMGAITNGIALDGTLRPYCGTFLIFSDYMKPAIRLAALMEVPSVFVFTHDSIYLGEDGPTHQPIEQIDALRAMPGMPLFRPADGLETAMSWAWIAAHRDGPAALSLTRQKVKALDRPKGFQNEDVFRGAYTVRESEGAPRVVIVASGSEVSLACDAAEKLGAERIPTRVVSLPCLELFLEQDEAYQQQILPRDGSALIVAVEAARGDSLHRLVAGQGFVYGIDRFGASAPYTDLAEFFGYTPDKLFTRIVGAVRESDEASG